MIRAKRKKSKSKYKNTKVVIDGIKFDSIKESKRYIVLKGLQEAGEISDLKLQPSFNIAKSVYLDGRKRAIRKYKADFSYINADGDYIVEDVKGFKTPLYLLKRHLVKEIHNIEVTEK